ncbi:ATPase [Emiliania huxleyi CCMP1516]|uniref:ATPase n=2 Tax=Emiliania huxleyi TaxID=2903 RepID=A0A0D3JYJ9_EMIH1|nr:ATPase [Emiliania huxleyi CCMP1516]EOD28584.1 ATPase [Emiliania huxleyi CCMP1516]|eukprot:XP_005781013.1 ATPase [Emiliania huxleyi CCMP1516]
MAFGSFRPLAMLSRLSFARSVRCLRARSCASASAAETASTAVSAQLSLPEAYDTLLTSGLNSDPAQRDLCYALEDLRSRVNAHREASQHYAAELADWRRTCARLQAEADAAEEARAREAANAPAWRKALNAIRDAAGGGGGIVERESPHLKLRVAQAQAHEDSGAPYRDYDVPAALGEANAGSHQPLSSEELAHPFWRTGLGGKTLLLDLLASALQADALADGGCPLSLRRALVAEMRAAEAAAQAAGSTRRSEEWCGEDEALSARVGVVSGGACVTGPGEAPLVLDDVGRPVSVGVLCYDEVQMMDIADATVLRGVLQALVGAGWVLVATCNRTPAEFAASTMQREHPQSRFAEAMAEHCDTLQLGDGGQLAAPQPSYFCPCEGGSAVPSPAAQLDRCFVDLTGGAAADEEVAIGAGRRMRLVSGRGVARASFERLCGTALGAGDYVALAQRYHTLCVDDLPQMSLRQRDQARRFITLVDQLYNHKTRLVASAAVPIGVTANSLETNYQGLLKTGAVAADSRKALFTGGDSLFTGEDETFAFRRAISRLNEMQSAQYLAARSRTRAAR